MPFTRKAVPTALVGAALLAALLGGCAGAPPTDDESTPLFASEEEAYAAAEETYRSYLRATDALDIADSSSIDAVVALTTGELQDAERKSFSEMKALGAVQHGESQIAWFKGVSADGSGRVLARVCIDVSDVTIFDTGGTSLIAASRPERLAATLDFVAGPQQALLISGFTPVTDDTCAA